MAADDHDQLLTVREVAERLRVHTMTVRRQIKAGLLPAVRVGRAVRVQEADLLAYISSPDAGSGYEVGGAQKEPATIRESAATLEASTDELTREQQRRRKAVESMRRLRDDIAPKGITTAVVARQGAGRPTPTPEELERRRRAGEEMRRLRDKSLPLGMTTAELVHLARTAREWMYDDDA